jgi:hypothetical protein
MISTSPSVGTTRMVTPRSAAAAAKSVLAGAVRPETLGTGTPSLSRLAADFSSERSVRELEV